MSKKFTKKVVELEDSDDEKDPLITIHIKSVSSDEEYSEKKKKQPKIISKKVIDLSAPQKNNKSSSTSKNVQLLSRKRNLDKSVEKTVKDKSKAKQPKPKISKPKNVIEYKKGKINTRIELVKKDNNLEEKEDEVNNTCCVVCSNRNCVRAAKTKNFTLMQNCI